MDCGARRGPLPGAITERIRAILKGEDGRAVLPGTAADEESPGAIAVPDTANAQTASAIRLRSMPTARASAIAIMGMLAFGVVVGSFASSNAESLDGQPLLLAVAPPATATSPASGSTSGSGSPGGGSQTGTGSSQSSGTSSNSGGGSASSSQGGGSGGSSGSGGSILPPVKHVFLILLSDQGYSQTFGATADDPYLAKTLRHQGELLENYYAVAPGALANEVALLSGQGPTPQTTANCPKFTAITPGKIGTEGQALGSGCVYPPKALTLADQLTAAKDTWKAYVQGIDGGPRDQATTCRHPALGGLDLGQAASRADPYVTWSNPFVYFRSIGTSACSRDDIGLDKLAADLKKVGSTPTFAYIVPSPCDDGNEQPCVPGAKSGLAAADAFLRSVVPEIESSAAYKANGLIAITFDEAPQAGPHADPSSCCDNPAQYPNLPTPVTSATTPTTTTPMTTTPTTTTPTTTTPTTTTPTTTTPTTTPTTTTATSTTPTATTPTTTTPAVTGGETNPTGGGGQVGLLLISRYVKPGSVDDLDYFNHFSLLSSIEHLFGLKRLGYARDPALPAFAKSQYNDYTP